jgi:hypothetical protein
MSLHTCEMEKFGGPCGEPAFEKIESSSGRWFWVCDECKKAKRFLTHIKEQIRLGKAGYL